MNEINPKTRPRDLKRYAQDYSVLQFEEIQEEFRRAELATVIESISPAHLVEVGCGRRSVVSGLNCLEHATIIEPISELLETNLEVLKNHLAIDGFNGLLNEFLVKSLNTFEMCVLSSLLHEVNDQAEMLNDCWKILDSDGVLIVNVPNAFSIHRILGLYLGKLNSVHSLTETQLVMQQMNAPFDPDSLRSLLEANGFRVEKLFTIIPKLVDHKTLNEIVASQLIDKAFLKDLNKLAGHLDGFGSEIIAVARKIG
jgi:2-polyprenyl-3-methyl-5-hydroxy-6-metoxy-1,4-benzoquinol methylase